jgi:hypothetical protein
MQKDTLSVQIVTKLHEWRMIVGTNLSRYEVIKDYRKTPYQRFSNGSRSSLRNHSRRETKLGKPQKTFERKQT